MSDTLRPDVQPTSTSVLLVTAHDWFASALQAVLEPEGFAFARVRSARLAVRDSRLVDPEIVIIGENLPDMKVPELATALRSAGLRESPLMSGPKRTKQLPWRPGRGTSSTSPFDRS